MGRIEERVLSAMLITISTMIPATLRVGPLFFLVTITANGRLQKMARPFDIFSGLMERLTEAITGPFGIRSFLGINKMGFVFYIIWALGSGSCSFLDYPNYLTL